LGVHGRELRRRRRVAEGDERGDGEPGQQPGARRLGRRLPGDEDAGADHGAESDGDGVAGAEVAGQARVRWGHPSILAVRRLTRAATAGERTATEP
jgi:hypothetical protein